MAEEQREYMVVRLESTGFCFTSMNEEYDLNDLAAQGWTIDKVLGWDTDQGLGHVVLSRSASRQNDQASTAENGERV